MEHVLHVTHHMTVWIICVYRDPLPSVEGILMANLWKTRYLACKFTFESKTTIDQSLERVWHSGYCVLAVARR